MTAGIWSRKDVRTVSVDRTVREAARRMLADHVGTLVVTGSDGAPEGMLTDRDIVTRCVARDFEPDVMTVAEAMSSPAHTVPFHASADDVLETMRAREVRRLVVVDKDGNMTGILALDDIVERLVEQGEEVGRLLRAQVHV